MKLNHAREQRFRRGACAIVVAILFGLTAQQGMAQAKTQRLYDGSGFSVKPDTISDFAMSSQTCPQVEVMIGGPDATRNDPGKIDWKVWSAERAVGIGTGWTVAPKNNCRMKAPWTGQKVRVTAFRRDNDKLASQQGRYSRVNVYMADKWRLGNDSEDYYRMTMVYTGGNRPGSGWYPFAVKYPNDLAPTGGR